MERSWADRAVALIIGLALAGSIIAGTYLVSTTIRYVKTFNNSLLTVTGYTQQQITSDEVKWDGSFTRTAPVDALKTGYTQMEHDLQTIKSYLLQHGITASEITFSPVTMMPVYSMCQAGAFGKVPVSGCVNTITSYRLTQRIEVNSSKVQQVTALAQNITPLISEGVLFSNEGLQYYYTKLNDLRVKLLTAATKDAESRAQMIAGSAHERVGRLLSENTGVFQITPLNSTQVSSVGTYNTSTIEKQITAVVRATFTLQP